MGEFEEKLNSILNDPGRMGKIAEMAKSLMGGAGEKTGKKDDVPEMPDASGISDLFSGADAAALSRISRLMGSMGSDDEKTALLKAMEPYLSDKRRNKMERAIKIARLAKLAQLAIGETGDQNV